MQEVKRQKVALWNTPVSRRSPAPPDPGQRSLQQAPASPVSSIWPAFAFLFSELSDHSF